MYFISSHTEAHITGEQKMHAALGKTKFLYLLYALICWLSWALDRFHYTLN